MTNKKKRIIHSPEFKAETLKLAEKVGVAAAARQLSLHESQIYAWRKTVKKNTTTSQREQELACRSSQTQKTVGRTSRSRYRKKVRQLLREKSKVIAMNSCLNTCCASVFSAWLRYSRFLEVGFIIGLSNVTRPSSARQFVKSLIQRSKMLLTTVKVEIVQDISRKNSLRTVIAIMLKPLQPA